MTTSTITAQRSADLYESLSDVVARHEGPLPRGALGSHLLGEYFDCSDLPEEADLLQWQMEETARRIGATIVRSVFHRFNPHGLSGVVVIAESHLAIHTWPEHRCASVDLFTCDDSLDIATGFRFLRDQFGAGRHHVVRIPRGTGLRTEPYPA